MRRLALVILAAMILLPTTGAAQDATPETIRASASLRSMLPTTSELGDGWSTLQTQFGIHSELGADRAVSTYGGPSGARLIVGIYDLPQQFSERSRVWEELRSYLWQGWADYYAEPDLDIAERPHVDPITTSEQLLPDGVGGGIAYFSYSELWAQDVAVGLFELVDGPAVFIALEGNLAAIPSNDALNAIAGMVATPISSTSSFTADYISNPNQAINLRSEGTTDSDVVVILDASTPLMSTGNETTDDSGTQWMEFVTETDKAGWIREVDAIAVS